MSSVWFLTAGPVQDAAAGVGNRIPRTPERAGGFMAWRRTQSANEDRPEGSPGRCGACIVSVPP